MRVADRLEIMNELGQTYAVSRNQVEAFNTGARWAWRHARRTLLPVGVTVGLACGAVGAVLLFRLLP